MGNYSLDFPSSHTNSTCNRQRCSLYLPVQDLLGMAAEHRGIIHPDQHIAIPNSKGVYPPVTSDSNTLGAAVSMKTPLEISPKESLPSFDDCEVHFDDIKDWPNLSAFENAVDDGEREQARHSEPSHHTIIGPLKWSGTTPSDYADDHSAPSRHTIRSPLKWPMTTPSNYADVNPADLYRPDRPDAVDGTLAPRIASSGPSEGRLSSETDLEYPEPTGRSSDSMIAATSGAKGQYDNDLHDLDVTLWCRACCKAFTGSPQNANSNLRRHLRESPRHNKNVGLRCPQPECRTRRPMRSDNLKSHLLLTHTIASASERQKILDECKLNRDLKGS